MFENSVLKTDLDNFTGGESVLFISTNSFGFASMYQVKTEED